LQDGFIIWIWFSVFFLFYLPNASRDRKNETGAGVAQARPVNGRFFRVDALVELSRWRGSWGKMI